MTAQPAPRPGPPVGDPADRTVGDVMRYGIVVCDAEATVRSVARAMRDHGVTSVLAVDLSGEAVGLVDQRDLLKGWEAPDLVRASEVMDAEPLVVDPGDGVGAAARRMLEAGVTRALVAPPPPPEEAGLWSEWKERGLPRGLLTVDDLVEHLDDLDSLPRQASARSASNAMRAGPMIAASVVAALVLVALVLVLVFATSHPGTVSPGCSHPTQGGC
jgi:CBS domain-containing protein